MARTKKTTQTKKTTKTVKADKKEQKLSPKQTPPKAKTTQAAKNSRKTTKPVVTETPSITEPVTPTETAKSTSSSYYKVPKNAVKFGALALVLALAVGAFLARNYLIVATVNGTPIYRWDVVRQLESQYGQQAVDRVITETLISQKATEQGIVVEESEIDEQMNQIEEQVTSMGQTFDAALAAEGLTRDELRHQIRTQKQLEQLAGEPSEITDEDIQSYIDQNRDFLPEEATEEELQDIARQQLSSQQDQQHLQETLTNLRAEADINYLYTFNNTL